jgi:hypothetical protein
MLRFILALVLALPAFAADLDRAPVAFAYQNSKAVYVDFLSAEYNITYNITARTASVAAKIRFLAPEAGYPIFDLASNTVSNVTLDGAASSMQTLTSPDGASTMRTLGSAVTAGEHVMMLEVPLATLVAWDNGGVNSATWLSDLSDRGYLERYMPANMEFDRVPMTFNVKFVGATKKQIIYANGDMSLLADGRTQIRFPSYFTSSSLYFHTVPEGVMAETRFSFRSIDGRELPVVIYLKPGLLGGAEATLATLKSETINILNELEGDYGPFLHPSVTIYNAGSGGMEYMGATMTSRSALGHELTHSYFARGMIPANGNAGWVDEAIASWRDEGYQRGGAFSGGANMAGRAEYIRYTDRQAYSYGEKFMRDLDNLFADKGGLKSLLREIVEKNAFQPFTTEDFISWAEGHYRVSLKQIFQQRVYRQALEGDLKSKPAESVHHQKLSIEELQQLL